MALHAAGVRLIAGRGEAERLLVLELQDDPGRPVLQEERDRVEPEVVAGQGLPKLVAAPASPAALDAAARQSWRISLCASKIVWWARRELNPQSLTGSGF